MKKVKKVQKEEEKKIQSLKIIKITDYKGYHVLVQQIFKINLFQAIIFNDGNFYQAYRVIDPKLEGKVHTDEELLKCAALMIDYAFQIIDALEAKKEAEEKLSN